MPVNTGKSSRFLILGKSSRLRGFDYGCERPHQSTGGGCTSGCPLDRKDGSSATLPWFWGPFLSWCWGPFGCVGIGCQAAEVASAPQPAAGAPAAASPAVRHTAPAAVSGRQVGCSLWSGAAAADTVSWWGGGPFRAGTGPGTAG